MDEHCNQLKASLHHVLEEYQCTISSCLSCPQHLKRENITEHTHTHMFTHIALKNMNKSHILHDFMPNKLLREVGSIFIEVY